MADLKPQKYDRELQKNLFPDNAFYKKSRVDGGIAPSVETVNIPEAGAVPTAKIGVPTSLPLTITQRTDSSKSYSVRQLYTEPVLITDEEEILTDYAKLQNIASDHANVLNEMAADIAAYEWATTAGTILTNDTATRATTVVGATGNVKRISKGNILSVRERFMKMNLRSIEGIKALVTPDQYTDLLLIDDFVRYDAGGWEKKLETGMVGRLMGIEFYVRWNSDFGANVVYSDNGVAKKAVHEGTAIASTDKAAAIFWHPDLVRHAEGNAKTYINRDKAEYLGTILNSKVRFGATKNRTDEVGVITIVEDN